MPSILSRLFEGKAVVALVLAHAVAGGVVLALRKRKNKKRELQKPGVVYLHQFPSARSVPSLSSPCLKLETYLRLANIEYEDVRGMEMSPLGKCPWIELDDVVVPDSDTVIDYLAHKIPDKDLDAHLTTADAAMAHLVKRTLEEHVYWGIVYNRWVEDKDKTISTVIGKGIVPSFVGKMIAAGIEKALYGHGLGRHPRTELYHRVAKDLKAASTILGDRPFFGGNAPCAADASVFGTVANILWTPFASPMLDLLKSDLRNLVAHAERIKALAWPDWDDCLAN
ncbi:hypothetical protein CTAYLR_001287 [Chrysophaeum taylorii]|uniref:Uncharacterized protein n=1 Tax=Chrysophaeum taylorii TaxID=2483200 RepID=A0AAD7UEE7_9STRA|nr:hypothetical protein CTAYLR_001287 [Chrysophaeum taylorii]